MSCRGPSVELFLTRLVGVHRLGQYRNVVIQRLVIKDTVEDRILALQERKVHLNVLCSESRELKF